MTTNNLTYRGFEWSVVLIGAVIALAISIVFSQFGAAIGLASDTPFTGEASLASWQVIATGLFVLWVQLMASFAGGYVAGYLRTPAVDFTAHENELHDGIYGLGVWATSTVLVFIAAALTAAVSTALALGAEATDGLADNGIVDALTNAEQNTALIFAFVAGSTALLSGAAAWYAATLGGDHRVNKIDHSRYTSFKKR